MFSTRLGIRVTFARPINVGPEKMVAINQLVDVAANIAGRRIGKNQIAGPESLRGRHSDTL